MLGKSGDYAKTGKLIVTVAAVAVDPTGLAAAGAGLDAYLHHHDRLAGRTPDLAKLSAETGRKLTTALKDKRFDKPDGARILLPQMLDCALPRGDDFVAHGLDHDAILDSLVARLTDPEHTRPEMIAAFRDLYGPLLAEICNDPRLKQALDPALVRDRVQREKRIETKVDNLDGRLANLEAQSRDMLEAIALRFGETAPEDMALADLKAFLVEKAKDYRALKAEVEAIDDGLKRLSNLKAAAKGAIEAGDLDEVENLLSRVQEVELEEAAKTAELRAGNALLRGRVEQAFTVLSAAADSFRAVDPLEPARRRLLGYQDMLYAHGLRFGGPGLALSADLARPALTDPLREKDPDLWAGGHVNLAIALQTQGERTAGPEGAGLLDEAVAAHRAALRVVTEEAHPVDWARTMQNLAIALQTQGERTAGPEGAGLLDEAVAAYRDALRVVTEEAHPVDWARTMQNLAGALQTQGARTAGPEGAGLLAEAVEAYRAALRVFTEDAHPVHWATTMQNLAIALQTQGARTAGPEGAGLLAEAVAAYRAALRVVTEEAHPVDWAMTMQNLAIALQTQGRRTAGPEGAGLLAEAVAAYRAALRVRTEDDHPVDWATTQENMALAEEAMAAHDATDEPRPHLEAALGHVEAALRVFDPEHTSHEHDQCTRLRDRIAAKLAALDG
ncbi:hypothetical protein [Rhodovulum marinum]|uniref:Tetratricopeptide repeat protein n=1 Tax=Rhodovulum marinum TaxID=320662 RepID=A0A4R2Q338_9RHOB|nr:hypothetical protein [Rhodovulum marinum]TCP43102.1 hypothetical protein EV662_102295 [Rhodovulum marinum]